jgi:predicted DNA-binding WGR domain protein
MDVIEVTAQELSYVDRGAGSDKFYRVFQVGSSMAVQYGRSGTFGTFKWTSCTDEVAAAAAASKQADAKFKKGYERVKSTVLRFDGTPSESQLDSSMSTVPAGVSVTDASEKQAAAHAAAVTKLNAVGVVEADPEVLVRVVAALQLRTPGFSVAADAKSDVVRPMLAETVEPARVDTLVDDDSWCAQLKLDGERFVVEVVDGTVAVWNRQGQPKTSNVAEAIVGPFRHLTSGRWVFDGEVVGRKLHLFDIVDAGGAVNAATPFVDRYATLAAVVEALGADADAVGIVGCAFSSADKAALLEKVADEQREGVIFRKNDASYQAGRRAAVLLKHKLVKAADCVVVATGVNGKENASVAVFDDTGQQVVVGSVSTIGKGTVTVGDVVEVQFLYVVDPAFPRMFQPRIIRVRNDKTAAECLIGQFADAGTNKQL